MAGSYTSALASEKLMISPPVTSTFPFGSNVAVCAARRAFNAPVVVDVPLAGSYSSAPIAPPLPPATSTVPFGSNVAVWVSRAVFKEPLGVQVPVAKSYSSALATSLPPALIPPVTSTCPLDSKVAR